MPLVLKGNPPTDEPPLLPPIPEQRIQQMERLLSGEFSLVLYRQIQEFFAQRGPSHQSR